GGPGGRLWPSFLLVPLLVCLSSCASARVRLLVCLCCALGSSRCAVLAVVPDPAGYPPRRVNLSRTDVRLELAVFDGDGRADLSVGAPIVTASRSKPIERTPPGRRP